MRKPKVKNKYNLKPKDIQQATILDFERLKQSPFWRNDVVSAWCLSDGAGKGLNGYIDSYWIGFYDAGKISLECTSHEDMCRYDFENFFDYKEIENKADLELQEKLLDRINWLIDEKIVEIKQRIKHKLVEKAAQTAADGKSSADVVEVVRKPVVGYEGHYVVDQFGRVYGIDRTTTVLDNGRIYENLVKEMTEKCENTPQNTTEKCDDR